MLHSLIIHLLLTVRAARRCCIPMREACLTSHCCCSPRHRSTITTLPTTPSPIPRTHIPRHCAHVALTGATTYMYKPHTTVTYICISAFMHVLLFVYTCTYRQHACILEPAQSTKCTTQSRNSCTCYYCLIVYLIRHKVGKSVKGKHTQ